MTAYVGITPEYPATLLTPLEWSADLGDHSLAQEDCLELAVAAGSSESPKIYSSPTAMLGRADVGRYGAAVDMTFFGGVMLWPRILDLGLVLSAKTYYLDLWNLTGRAQYMTNWTIVGLDGVLLTNSEGFPVWFESTQYRSYRVDILPEGQAEIAGSVTFNFTGLDPSATTLTLSGTRIVVFSFEPNWREPVTENLEWLTDVLTAHNGREQRLALRGNPRRALKYLFTFEHKNKVTKFESYMWGWQHRVFALPVWTDWAYPTSNISAGSSSISVSTDLRDFAATRMAIIWRDYLNWEVVEVQSLTSVALTLTQPTLYGWTTMDRVIPIRLGRMGKTLSVPRPSSTIAEATVTFTLETEEAVDSHRLGTSSLTQYQGLDVMTYYPNADEELSDTYERDIEVVDYDLGAWSNLDKVGAPTVVRPYRWLLKTRQEIMNFLAFLEAHKGKQVPFWVPTWSQDVELMQTIVPSDVGILIKNFSYTQMLNVHPNRRDLIFFDKIRSNTPTIKRITACAELVGTNEMLTLDSAFGIQKLVTDFSGISFLTLCRFDQDEFTLTWHSDSIMVVTVNLREVLQ